MSALSASITRTKQSENIRPQVGRLSQLAWRRTATDDMYTDSEDSQDSPKTRIIPTNMYTHAVQYPQPNEKGNVRLDDENGEGCSHLLDNPDQPLIFEEPVKEDADPNELAPEDAVLADNTDTKDFEENLNVRDYVGFL